MWQFCAGAGTLWHRSRQVATTAPDQHQGTGLKYSLNAIPQCTPVGQVRLESDTPNRPPAAAAALLLVLLLRCCVCSGYGYGAGIRIDSPLGPVRLEYAWNEQRSGRFHVALGYD